MPGEKSDRLAAKSNHLPDPSTDRTELTETSAMILEAATWLKDDMRLWCSGKTQVKQERGRKKNTTGLKQSEG